MTATWPARVVSPTEERNPHTTTIDEVPTAEVLRMISSEDLLVAPSVAAVLPALAGAVDCAVTALESGHRVHYFGAGSSGRTAVLDAAELGPTYALEPGRVVAHMAGGLGAVESAVEDVEDDPAAGQADAADVVAGDVVVGLTASGRTPYV
ncbi:MAG: N-acetylmuramic acid 6-phosphate etherase, partial [Mycobacteriales bacterium]